MLKLYESISVRYLDAKKKTENLRNGIVQTNLRCGVLQAQINEMKRKIRCYQQNLRKKVKKLIDAINQDLKLDVYPIEGDKVECLSNPDHQQAAMFQPSGS